MWALCGRSIRGFAQLGRFPGFNVGGLWDFCNEEHPHRSPRRLGASGRNGCFIGQGSVSHVYGSFPFVSRFLPTKSFHIDCWEGRNFSPCLKKSTWAVPLSSTVCFLFWSAWSAPLSQRETVLFWWCRRHVLFFFGSGWDSLKLGQANNSWFVLGLLHLMCILEVHM